MKYLVILLVLIGFVGIAFGQYLGDKLPPRTMSIDESGEYMFPPDYVDFYYSDSRFDHYFVTEGIYRYDIPYMISNGTISGMRIDCDSVELILDIESSDQGWLTLALPRHLVDSQIGNKKDVFFVLTDSKETQHSDIASEKLRLLIIPISNDTSQINIIGLNYPEQMGENACNGKHEPPFSYLLSPLKQIKSKVPIEEIQCKDGLVLVTKNNGSSACVKPETIERLIERGWAEPLENIQTNQSDSSNTKSSAGVIPFDPNRWNSSVGDEITTMPYDEPESSKMPVTQKPAAPLGHTMADDHQHASILVKIFGDKFDFSVPQYQIRSSWIHFEGNDGNTIHRHSKGIELGYLFDTLNLGLSTECFVFQDKREFCTNDDYTLKFYINGNQVTDIQDYVIMDNDRILISFGPENIDEIKEQLMELESQELVY